MFHPMAPNFLLSRITAWKNARENNNFLYSVYLEQELNSLSLTSLNVLRRFAFKPLGGSLVSLIPLWRTGTGNRLVGIDVSQSL
jgi:hypothetical protein